MLTRLITIIVAVPIVIWLVFFQGGLPLAGLVGAAAVLGLIEFYRAAEKGGAKPHIPLGIIAGAIILLFGRDSYSDSTVVIVPVFIGLLLISLAVELFKKSRAPFTNIGVTVLGECYIVLLLMHFIWLRNMTGTGPRGLEMGAWYVMFTLFTTWALDIGAYLAGRFFGKHKLAPSISPGKTIEGSVGGLISAIIMSACVASVIGISAVNGVVIGILVGITGQMGDLAGSSFKREVGIKDFGALLPGHGGILDRIDSLLFTGPVVFWYMTMVVF